MVSTVAIRAAVAFPDPPGGRTYIYNGDQLQIGQDTGYAWLDGTWGHDNGSDAFDGSQIGGTFGDANRPGGAMLGTEANVTYLRMQDTGDPRDYGYSGEPPGTNRKIYFGRLLTADSAQANTLLDDGVTLTIRARVPTLAKAGGPLDPIHPDGRQTAEGVHPYPTEGDGYIVWNEGKGNFVIRQQGNGTTVAGGAIAFAFTQTTDTTGGNPTNEVANFAGLTMNESNGNVPSNDVDFGEGSGTNYISFDPTEWHELYIVVRKDPANVGTHETFVFWDGSLNAIVFKTTAGLGTDVSSTESFIAMGGPATGQSWALDVDFIGYKDAAVFPPGAKLPPVITDISPSLRAPFYDATKGITFTATTRMLENTLPKAGFSLTLNGQDVSSQIVLTGADTDKSRRATYSGLQPNAVYVGEIVVTDSGSLSVTNPVNFATFVQANGLLIESEDYNEAGGNSPPEPTVPGGSENVTGVLGVDYFDTSTNAAAAYRPSDFTGLEVSGDVARPEFVTAGVSDHVLIDVVTTEWLNFTRTFPTVALDPYVRAAGYAQLQVLQLDQVTGDISITNQTTRPLGLFPVSFTGGYNAYGYTRLADAFGVPQRVRFSGKATVRLTARTADNYVNHNYLYFNPSTNTGPILPWAISASPIPNAQNVPASAAVQVSLIDGESPVNLASIQMKLDGTDVTSSLTKTDTTLGADVSYSPGTMTGGSAHTVELTYADTSARSSTRTWTFTVAGSAQRPTMTIQPSGGNVIVSWTPEGGTLKESTNLSDWTNVSGNPPSPATLPIAPSGAKYYRVEQ